MANWRQYTLRNGRINGRPVTVEPDQEIAGTMNSDTVHFYAAPIKCAVRKKLANGENENLLNKLCIIKQPKTPNSYRLCVVYIYV